MSPFEDRAEDRSNLNLQNNEHSPNDRQLNSYGLNHESISRLAIDNRSTAISAVATVPQIDANSTASNKDSIVLTTVPETQQLSKIVKAQFNSLVLGMKVFTYLVAQALSVSENEDRPDLVTPLVEYGCYETLARMLLRCKTPEALAVLRSIFPPILLFESLTCLDQPREHLQRLKKLEVEANSEIPSHQPIYVYWGELEIPEDLGVNGHDLKERNYLPKGTLVVDLHYFNTQEKIQNNTTRSLDELTSVQILGRANSSYSVNYHDLIQLC